MAIFYLKRRDTRPVLEAALKNPDLSAHDLTGATSASLHVRLSDGTVFTRTMVIDAVPTTGIVRYTFLDTDWSGSPPVLFEGVHRMEYEIKGSGGARLTFPNADHDELRVKDDIGQTA